MTEIGFDPRAAAGRETARSSRAGEEDGGSRLVDSVGGRRQTAIERNEIEKIAVLICSSVGPMTSSAFVWTRTDAQNIS
jgi:hypothetical protein